LSFSRTLFNNHTVENINDLDFLLYPCLTGAIPLVQSSTSRASHLFCSTCQSTISELHYTHST